MVLFLGFPARFPTPRGLFLESAFLWPCFCRQKSPCRRALGRNLNPLRGFSQDLPNLRGPPHIEGWAKCANHHGEKAPKWVTFFGNALPHLWKMHRLRHVCVKSTMCFSSKMAFGKNIKKLYVRYFWQTLSYVKKHNSFNSHSPQTVHFPKCGRWFLRYIAPWEVRRWGLAPR